MFVNCILLISCISIFVWFVSCLFFGVLSLVVFFVRDCVGFFSVLLMFFIKVICFCWFFLYRCCVCLSFLFISILWFWLWIMKICVCGVIWLWNMWILYSLLLIVVWIIFWCCFVMVVMFCRFKCGSKWLVILLFMIVWFDFWLWISRLSGSSEIIFLLIVCKMCNLLLIVVLGMFFVLWLEKWWNVV